jgi:hypothetical protein
MERRYNLKDEFIIQDIFNIFISLDQLSETIEL